MKAKENYNLGIREIMPFLIVVLWSCGKDQIESTSNNNSWHVAMDSAVGPSQEYFKEIEQMLRNEHQIKDDEMDYYIQFLIDEEAISPPHIVFSKNGEIITKNISYKDYRV